MLQQMCDFHRSTGLRRLTRASTDPCQHALAKAGSPAGRRRVGVGNIHSDALQPDHDGKIQFLLAFGNPRRQRNLLCGGQGEVYLLHDIVPCLAIFASSFGLFGKVLLPRDNTRSQPESVRRGDGDT